MISDSEYLERVVAGIHALTTAGAEVSWNEVINDRQFDVVVRFKLGSLSYLVLIEVKNRTRKATASDMDAFVLKARDQNANKAVFVTAAGFQDGAVRVAKRHGADLFTLTFDETRLHLPSEGTFITLSRGPVASEIALGFSVGEPNLIANIEDATLVYADGEQFDLPTECSQMDYYARNTSLQDGRSLCDLMETAALTRIGLGESRRHEITVDPPQLISPPDDYFFPRGPLTSMLFTVTGRQGRPMKGNVGIEPSSFRLPVLYRNVITGELNQFAIDQLPLGVNRVSVGGFYFLMHPLRYYYCASIDQGIVCLYLIESFQLGKKFRATLTQDIKYSVYYIPVSDQKILERLRKRLDDYLRLTARN